MFMCSVAKQNLCQPQSSFAPLEKPTLDALISFFDKQLANPRLVTVLGIDRAKGAFLVEKKDGREGIDAEVANERAFPSLAVACGGQVVVGSIEVRLKEFDAFGVIVRDQDTGRFGHDIAP